MLLTLKVTFKKGNMKVVVINIYSRAIIVITVLLLLPGCGRVIDWGSKTFIQSPMIESDIVTAQKYIRSVTTYDQLTTRARFDALWLSDEVRKNYINLFAAKFGKTDEQKKTFLRRQIEENNHLISFYVLSLHDYPLGDLHSEWTLFLNIDGKNYAPIEIKTVELSPEYIYIFGKKYNRFKVPYSVKFDAKDVNDEPLITESTERITLYCRSISAEVAFVWDINQDKE
jgi:hypothetical protein